MRPPKEVLVIGGGRMGTGIAMAFVLAGSRVIVLERDGVSAARAEERTFAAARTAVERSLNAPSLAALRERIGFTSDSAALRPADLVVEAVPEEFALKAEALASVQTAVGPEAWFATNTSSLSVGDLSLVLTRPERLIGLHFFNPVLASDLVEIVVAERTSRELCATAREWVSALGKTAIVVKDLPGFASSRLGVSLALEAIRMLEEGVATAEDIDTAMVLGYRHAMGPLRTTDLVGLDVRLEIAEYLNSRYGERFAPPRTLREMVAAGHLGRKTKRGFYDYS